jgi:hypothetical protein
MRGDDGFILLLGGLFFGALIVGLFTGMTMTSNADIKSEKVFIIEKATYKCKKTNELSLEEKEAQGENKPQ